MNEISLQGIDLPTINSGALAKISAGMLEQARVNKIFGRSNSQTTVKAMSLTMLAAAPYRYLRQCAAEIESRKQALNEAGFSLRKAKLQARQHRERAETLTGVEAELELLEAEKLESGIVDSRTYVEGALKDIAALQDSYDQIKESHGIRDGWDEEDFERGEIEHHVKAAFRLAYREVMSHGRLTHAPSEYFEQFGIHPQVGLTRVMEYIASCNDLLSNHQAPNILHFHSWLESCYQAHKNDVYAAVAIVGVKDLITKWSLYVEPEVTPSG